MLIFVCVCRWSERQCGLVSGRQWRSSGLWGWAWCFLPVGHRQLGREVWPARIPRSLYTGKTYNVYTHMRKEHVYIYPQKITMYMSKYSYFVCKQTKYIYRKSLCIHFYFCLSVAGCSLLWLDQTSHRMATSQQVQLLMRPTHTHTHTKAEFMFLLSKNDMMFQKACYLFTDFIKIPLSANKISICSSFFGEHDTHACLSPANWANLFLKKTIKCNYVWNYKQNKNVVPTAITFFSLIEILDRNLHVCTP